MCLVFTVTAISEKTSKHLLKYTKQKQFS